MKDEVLKLALGALEESETNNDTMEFWDRKTKAINAIKQALAAQPAPVQPAHISPKQLLALAQEANLGLDKVIEAFRIAAPVQEPVAHSYASTQATMCACCGEHKHTPLRIDKMGGYVCLTCIDKKLGSLLGEFGYPAAQPAVPDAITDDSESLEYRTGWNDCRAEMLKGMK
jgi:hypothetical protein